MRRTKIIATIGPSSLDRIKEIEKAGADVLRINFSHATPDQIERVYNEREKAKIMLDTAGPEVRIVDVENPVKVLTDDIIIISSKESDPKNKVFRVDHDIIDDFEEGQYVLIDDGRIAGIVKAKREKEVEIRILRGGEIMNRRKICIFGKSFNLNVLMEKDIELLKVANEFGIEIVSVSFVRDEKDIAEVKRFVGEEPTIIAKIETKEGVYNIDKILKVCDGIEVARGDLATAFPLALISKLEQDLLRKCIRAGKIGIVATEVMESMVERGVPTRAEITDIYFAVLNGADAIMLSRETSIGKYPVLSVETLSKILTEIENDVVKMWEERPEIGRKYKEFIEFIKVFSEKFDKIYLDVQDQKIIYFMSKYRLFPQIMVVKNEFVKETNISLLFGCKITKEIEEGYPFIKERNGIMEIKVFC